MPKSKPESEADVFLVMQEYSKKKGYSFTDTQLRFMAENCYLLYESKGWCGTTYWPPLAMKWLLNEKGKFGKEIISYKKPKPHQSSYAKRQGKSVRDEILERENGRNDTEI